MYFGLCKFYPRFAQANLQVKMLSVALAVGIPYYLSALAVYFISPQSLLCNSQGKGFEFGGRCFYLNSNFFNPSNHLVLATIVIFFAVTFALLEWV